MYSYSTKSRVTHGVQSARIAQNITKSIIRKLIKSPKRLLFYVCCFTLLYILLSKEKLPMKAKRKTTRELNINGPFPWWDDDNLTQCKKFMELKKKNDKITPAALEWNEGPYSFDQNVSVSHCGVRAFLRGYEQNVITYSLYGSKDIYFRGLPDILADVGKMYPGYSVRVHTDPRGRQPLLCPLLVEFEGHFDICDVVNLPPPFGNITDVRDKMFYRLVPYGDYQISRLLVRDLDGKFFDRDFVAVQHWIRSGKLFHVMRDNPKHKMEIPGGLHSLYQPNQTIADIFNSVRKKVFKSSVPGDDQQVLRYSVHKYLYIDNGLQHDAYDCMNHNGSVPFPTKREGTRFAGNQHYQWGEYPRAVICPPECRPKDHQDWIFC